MRDLTGSRDPAAEGCTPQEDGALFVGMMTSHPALLDRHVANHAWMFFPPGLAHHGDWPDLAGCRAPCPLLVQYLRDDRLFPLDGMQAAHARLAAIYEHAGAADAYVGEFYAGRHRFDRVMQESAFDHLQRWLVK